MSDDQRWDWWPRDEPPSERPGPSATVTDALTRGAEKARRDRRDDR